MTHLDLHTYPTTQAPRPGAHPQQQKNQPQSPLLDPTPPHSAFNSFLKRRVASGGGATPRIDTPVSVKGKGFKSSPLFTEMDIADGLKKGTSNVTREVDESVPPSGTVM